MPGLPNSLRDPRWWLAQPMRRPATVALLVIVLVAGCSFGASVTTGAWVPQNDDWSYIRSAFELRQTGRLQLQGWGQMFLLGQLLTAQPFLLLLGSHVASLKLYGVTMAALWMWCAFVLARRCVGWRAVAVPVVLALWPGLPLLASSFMTDLPAAATALLTLVVGLRSVDEQSRRWLLATVLVGVFAFTIREQAVAGLGAVLAGVLVHPTVRPRFRRDTLAAVAAAAVVCVVLVNVRHGMAHPDLPAFDLSFADTWRSFLRVPFTLGLLLSPLCLWVVWSRAGDGRRGRLDLGRLSGWTVGLVAIAALAVTYFPHLPRVLLSNYATPVGGFLVSDVGYAPTWAEPWLWHLAQIVGCVGGTVLLGELGARVAGGPAAALDRLRCADPAATMLTAYTGFVAASVVALSVVGQYQVDRYQITMLPGLAVLLLATTVPDRTPVPRALLVGATALAVLLVALSVGNTLTTNHRDRAVWDTARALTRRGVPPTHVNAGLDWNGFHATTPLDRDHSDAHGYRGQQWMYLFPAATDCYVVAPSELHRDFLVPVRISRDAAARGVHAYRNLRCRRLPAAP